MNLKDLAYRVLRKENGTVSGTNSGTACPIGSADPNGVGHQKNGMNTGMDDNCPSVPNIYGETVGHLVKSGTPHETVNGTFNETDPFEESGEAVKVFFPAIGRDIWICADEKARTMVGNEGLSCLLFDDLRFILQGKPGEERRNRLIEVCARRHPVTEEVLRVFEGKITSVDVKDTRGNTNHSYN